ncbi:MaoC family dehydratase [Arvimicrobium flavum]|uniref:MaoC family dehydratase n=1 Tax=Arvimicrobium flavum TaxID=3393320 RepID=UPI00237B4A71|nr:MaoC family dehydratase [Mesorhizobium shangrilense]
MSTKDRPLPAVPAGTEITITQAMIDEYARISGDFNPLHVDMVMAARTPFGGTIAHGCIPMEPIFKAVQAMIGKPVMPAGSTMSLRYLQPSRPGDRIHLQLQASDVDGGKARFAFACVNQRGDKVIEGRCSFCE